MSHRNLLYHPISAMKMRQAVQEIIKIVLLLRPTSNECEVMSELSEWQTAFTQMKKIRLL